MNVYDKDVIAARGVLKGPVEFITVEEDGYTVACDENGRIVGLLHPMRGWSNYHADDDRFAV